MNRRRLLLTAASVFALACAAALAVMWEPAIPSIQRPPPSAFSADLRLQGARVIALGDCAVCHTAKDGKPFAGGLPLVTPFGTIYATNITPDETTGIGGWSIEAFTRALRRGIARDGHQLYPAFPYVHFTHIPASDITAAYAYLMTRDPVRAVAPANRLLFPLNFRPLVAFWNVLFLDRTQYEEDPEQTGEWNRGRRLVDGLGHCAACHTPLSVIGSEQRGHAFEGGLIDGWDAYPLTELSNAPKPWTKDQLAKYLRTGMASEHGAAAGPMLAVTRDLATVPEQDVQAISTYILSLQKPWHMPLLQSANAQTTSPSVQRGKILFTAACESCHGNAAPMQSIGKRPSLTLSTAVNAATPRNATQMILGGIPWNGADRLTFMPAFEDEFSDDQLTDIVDYLRATYSDNKPWTSTVNTVSSVRKENQLR